MQISLDSVVPELLQLILDLQWGITQFLLVYHSQERCPFWGVLLDGFYKCSSKSLIKSCRWTLDSLFRRLCDFTESKRSLCASLISSEEKCFQRINAQLCHKVVSSSSDTEPLPAGLLSHFMSIFLRQRLAQWAYQHGERQGLAAPVSMPLGKQIRESKWWILKLALTGL